MAFDAVLAFFSAWRDNSVKCTLIFSPISSMKNAIKRRKINVEIEKTYERINAKCSFCDWTESRRKTAANANPAIRISTTINAIENQPDQRWLNSVVSALGFCILEEKKIKNEIKSRINAFSHSVSFMTMKHARHKKGNAENNVRTRNIVFVDGKNKAIPARIIDKTGREIMIHEKGLAGGIIKRRGSKNTK